MLWNIFRALPDYCAFYEPCHDNLIAHICNTKPKERHVEVTSYWDEYLPVLEELKSLHSHEFGVNRLLLEFDDRYDDLERYIRFLIRNSGGKTPVLQFNRMDFRLPWLKARFPEDKIIHLHRDPRDSWLSMVKHLPPEEWDNPYHSDIYDLFIWSVSLAGEFPFIADEKITNSYQRYYYIWRLSKIMGCKYSDCSLDFQKDFQDDPERAIQKITEIDSRFGKHIDEVLSRIGKRPSNTWTDHRTADWFEEKESRCEEVLKDLGLLDNFGTYTLRMIKERYQEGFRESIHMV